jgi:hypothetical protein
MPCPLIVKSNTKFGWEDVKKVLKQGVIECHIDDFLDKNVKKFNQFGQILLLNLTFLPDWNGRYLSLVVLFEIMFKIQHIRKSLQQP